jgi:SagB-type dehydrogenase family enzyme
MAPPWFGSFHFFLTDGAQLDSESDDRIVVRTKTAKVILKRLTPGLRQAFQSLEAGAGEEQRLAGLIAETDGSASLSKFYYCLLQMSRRGLLDYSVVHEGCRLASLTPISHRFMFPPRGLAADRFFVLSRFAYMRALAGEMILESPLAHARIVLHEERAALLVHALARPCGVEELGARAGNLPTQAVKALLSLLFHTAFAGEADEKGTSLQDETPVLQYWEFHDLLFHTRSRSGRQDLPTGGICRFAGRFVPPAAVKPVRATQSIELFRPDQVRLQREDQPFAGVQEMRCSVREYAARAITAVQLGEFLFRVARVKQTWQDWLDTPVGPIPMELTARPYPGGGGLYELELYAAVQACTGLDRGLYHYNPLHHQLEPLKANAVALQSLLAGAGQSTGVPGQKLQVLLIISARFQRVMWKYAAMAYALILKNVGVLYQTMYLAATAMGLAPCAVGCGDAHLFAQAADTDFYDESSVGEFLLGTKP